MALTKLDRLKMLMGEDDLPIGNDPVLEEGIVEEEITSTAVGTAQEGTNLVFQPTDYDMFHGEEYRDDNIVPAYDSSDEGPRTVHRQRRPKSPNHKHNQLHKERDVTRLVSPNAGADATTSGFIELDSRIGQLALPEQVFCPIQAVAKYPYRYVNKEAEEAIARKFFAGGKFYERNWDVYYLHAPYSLSTKPLLFVLAEQVYDLLDEINKTFGCKLGFPANSVESGFEMSFSEEHVPRPRFLGQCNTQAAFKELERNIPSISFKPDHEKVSEAGQPTDKSLNAFKKKVELALEIARNRNKASKAKKRTQRIDRQQGWVKELKKAQRFLGLRPEQSAVAEAHPPSDDDQLWEDTQQDQEHSVPGENTKQLDTECSAPFPFDKSVVFVCVDVEAFERNHNIVTEIGVATLDTNDLIGTCPGESGRNWISKIRSRHFRVSDNSHLQNKDFVDGCADKFEFGKSEWVTLRDAPQVVASCFRPPFSAPNLSSLDSSDNSSVDDEEESHAVDASDDITEDYQGTEDLEQGKTTTERSTVEALGEDVAEVCINDENSPEADEIGDQEEEEPEDEANAEPRNIVLVGHDVSIDVGYLQKIGYNPHNLSNLIQVIDTANLYRAWKRDSTTRSLATIFYDLDFVGWNFHNAGNDATYTLQAMLWLSIRALTPLSKEAMKEERLEKAREALKVAAEKIWDDGEGWSDVDEVGGGVVLGGGGGGGRFGRGSNSTGGNSTGGNSTGGNSTGGISTGGISTGGTGGGVSIKPETYPPDPQPT
ncbi:hypothetical protein L228DRAFT_90810 [Xylona heveae TC161]|uniref:Gfd2/YDR514C-like C-terminal domain-containing protein n=1 Tax=Xylona heveae (strain CBS 132557 / TC161) TaxID=1328760 RepID=A0A161TPK8_XYLHT|nr:hypothetical protein L228DRAFT_90810 [Xylona heveae TC161]KZF24156.1 hypothetical protein L228DRAFT_90810 [Xylona heveae TC161]